MLGRFLARRAAAALRNLPEFVPPLEFPLFIVKAPEVHSHVDLVELVDIVGFVSFLEEIVLSPVVQLGPLECLRPHRECGKLLRHRRRRILAAGFEGRFYAQKQCRGPASLALRRASNGLRGVRTLYTIQSGADFVKDLERVTATEAV